MSYQVIARKWRPQNFDDVVGQEAVTRTLKNALKTGRIAHAFLFSGIRGVGKTTVARILAMCMNCSQGITESPCGECDSCREIRQGNAVDVQEIDAASNRGIDNIRELNASVRYGTARDRFKIFIVDEVHMLTNEAFNALLKTLEEPPAHVKFILATTEFHRVPITIASRCQKYEFRPISFSNIVQQLRLIAREEGIEISDYAINVLAAAGQGSMRDAQSAFDKLIAFGGTRVDDADVRALLGVIDQGVVAELIEAIRRRDRTALIAGVQELTLTGIAPQVVCGKLVERIRNLLVCKTAGWDEGLLRLPDSEKDSLLGQAEAFSELELIRMYDLIHRTQNDLKWHSQPGVHLEISLLKLVEVAGLPSIEEVIGQLRSGTVMPAAEGGHPLPSSGTTGTSEVPPMANQAKSGSQASRTGSSQEAAASEAHSSDEATDGSESGERASDDEPGPTDRPDDVVGRLLEKLKTDFKGVHALISEASRISIADGRLKVSFPEKSGVYADLLAKGDNYKRLSGLYASISGSESGVEVAVEEASPESAEGPLDPREDPAVKRFVERFPGKIVIRRTE